jgi:anti-anti-sigma regulatory factor
VSTKKAPRTVKRARASQRRPAKPPAAVAQPAAAAPPAHIELDARLTIVQAADLHRLLMARLAGGEPLVIDGTRVEEIDTAILQLLTSLWRTAQDRGIACTWHGASEPLRYTADLIGVAGVLSLPSLRERGDAAA